MRYMDVQGKNYPVLSAIEMRTGQYAKGLCTCFVWERNTDSFLCNGSLDECVRYSERKCISHKEAQIWLCELDEDGTFEYCHAVYDIDGNFLKRNGAGI